MTSKESKFYLVSSIILVILLGALAGVMLTRKEYYFYTPPEYGLFISWAEGDMMYSRDGEIWSKVTPSAFLRNGSRLRTGKDSRAILKTPQNSTIRVDENTEIGVAQLNLRDILITQFGGRTYHEIYEKNEGVYQVRALNNTIKALGTAFEITTNLKDNRVNTRVFSGKIDIAVAGGDNVEVQKIGENKQITIDPKGDNIISVGNVEKNYAEKSWFNWNIQGEMSDAGVKNSKTETLPSETTAPGAKQSSSSAPSGSKKDCYPSVTAVTDKKFNGIKIAWTPCADGDFQFYKLIRSTLSATPKYPGDPVILSSSNRSYTNFLDKSVAPNRTYYYRVCVVQPVDRATCGNIATATY